MNIESITVGAFQANCYVVWKSPDEAIVIDPGADAPEIRKTIEQHGLTVILYLLTHGHMDHVSALSDMLKTHPAPIALHRADADWAFTEKNAFPPYYPVPIAPPTIDRHPAAGDRYTDGGMHYYVVETPGHTPGGVIYVFEEEKVAFSGDTLFAGSIGRTDLPGGDMAVFKKSLASLSHLPHDLVFYPGHGPETQLDHELRTNPFLLNLDSL